jgi:hypothetical protein
MKCSNVSLHSRRRDHTRIRPVKKNEIVKGKEKKNVQYYNFVNL